MAGHNLQPIDDKGINFALANPIGTKTIHELAKGKKEVVIAFDDMRRPTPVFRLVPFVLEELKKAGIREDHVRFICATGAHRPRSREELAKKLGEDTVEGFYVYNHNCYDHLEDLGSTSRRTPVKVNREFMECDLKIGIGLIIAHETAGFGGGGKIVLPGLSSIDTIAYNHIVVKKRALQGSNPTVGFGKVSCNDMRLDIEEAARMASLDVKLDAVINNNRELVGLFVGDFVSAHRVGCAFAKTVYQTEPLTNADVVVLNGYPLDEGSSRSFWAGRASVRTGGDVVVMYGSRGCPDGWGFHYFSSRHGTKYGGPNWSPPRTLKIPQARRIILFSKNFQKVDIEKCGPPEKVLPVKSWKEVIEELENTHGNHTRVAVYPYASIQSPRFPDGW